MSIEENRINLVNKIFSDFDACFEKQREKELLGLIRVKEEVIKICASKLDNEEENNISDYEAKVIIINNLQDELCASRGKEEHYRIMSGKNLALGVSIGIMIATIIVQIMDMLK